ncbi:hypothetical protein ACFFUP_10460 [Vibrio ostreicida]|uniref:Uncharacterized protein n=1 Tax=Vibrio ostreicida TaxID=526588 RepID=A0ABT8BZS3_9VIBR|nr:hypothetical protein [Vibrio ostreicida]MDN3612513.1 hypothetical protein [Vibrio ostreicida]NPD09139.1 hypothetical protein [Vibrio ostreicida]
MLAKKCLFANLVVAALMPSLVQSSDDVRLLDKSFATTHNSYSGSLKGHGNSGSIIQQLDNGVYGLEFDIYPKYDMGGIGHDGVGDEVYLQYNANPSSFDLRIWFSLINDWSNLHSSHPPLFISVDFKQQSRWTESELSDFLDGVKGVFGDKLVTPNHVPAVSEMTMADAKGKLFVISNHDKFYDDADRDLANKSNDIQFLYGGDLDFANFTGSDRSAISKVKRNKSQRFSRVYKWDQYGHRFYNDNIQVTFPATDYPFYSQYQKVLKREHQNVWRDQDFATFTIKHRNNYDQGREPAVSINSQAGGHRVVEVHRSQNNDGLWYRLGTLDKRDYGIDWQGHGQYSSGIRPNVSVNDNGMIVAVHKSQNNNAIWFVVGEIVNNNIQWQSARKSPFQGYYPDVALTDDNQIVVVFSDTDYDNIHYAVGSLASDKTIDFPDGPHIVVNDKGRSLSRPQVDVNDTHQLIVSWEQSQSGAREGWTRIGYLDVNRLDIEFNTESSVHRASPINRVRLANTYPFIYDTAHFPSVALSKNGNTVTTHRSPSGDDLWYRIGKRGRSTQIQDVSVNYTKGREAKIDMNDEGYTVEVHQSQNNSGLWLSVGKLQE